MQGARIMARTKKTAENRRCEFIQASRPLPPLRNKRGDILMSGAISPNNWGANWSRRYRAAYPDLTELFDTLDRLREEHRAANAQESFLTELRRLEKL